MTLNTTKQIAFQRNRFADATKKSGNEACVVSSPDDAPPRRDQSRKRDAPMAFTTLAFTASALRHGKLLVATALTTGMLTTVSHAYTQEQEQMCTGDAMRLCSADIPDVERVTACMIRQRALLSDGCKAVFRYEPAAPVTPANYSPAGKPSKPLNIAPHKRG
jgi:hypothetical protein